MRSSDRPACGARSAAMRGALRPGSPVLLVLLAAVTALASAAAHAQGVRQGNCWTDYKGVNHCGEAPAAPTTRSPASRAAPPAPDYKALFAEQAEERARAAYELGRTLFDAGEYAKAEIAFGKAIQHWWRDANLRGWFALTEERLGKYQSAIFHYKAQLSWDPGNASALANMGHCYQRLGDRARALDAYRKAATFENATPEVRDNITAWSSEIDRQVAAEQGDKSRKAATEQARREASQPGARPAGDLTGDLRQMANNPPATQDGAVRIDGDKVDPRVLQPQAEGLKTRPPPAPAPPASELASTISRPDTLKLGGRTANLAMDAIQVNGHNLEQARNHLHDLLGRNPNDQDLRDAESYVEGMAIGEVRAGAKKPVLSGADIERDVFSPKPGLDSLKKSGAASPAARQALDDWKARRDQIFWTSANAHGADYTQVRQELEKMSASTPGDTALRSALRKAQGVEVYRSP